MSLGIDVDRGAADTAGWAVHAWGSPDDQPIVLLHGFMQTGDSWSTMVQNLARCYYVVAPTMVARSAEDATLAAMATGAYGAAQQAMLHTGRRSVVLVGYSRRAHSA
jgi:pimeloyl-ACP methyl ester carboxylesterase